MPLLKKIAFGIFVIASVMLGIWGYNALKQNKKPSKDVLTLMPDSCLLYCSTKNFSDLNVKLNSQNLIFNSWTVFGEVKELKDDLRFYDSLIYSNELLNEVTENNGIHFAIYPSEKKLLWLAAFNLKEQKQEKDILEFCASHLKEKTEGVFGINERSFLAVKQGAVIISNSEALIKKSFEKGNKLISNKTFVVQIQNVGKNDEMCVYVNHSFLSKDLKSQLFRIGALLNATESAASVKFSPTEMILNGNYKPGNQLLQQVIGTQEPLSISLYDQLPFGTNFFKAIAVSSSNNLSKIVVSKEEVIKFWSAINNKALYNASNEFYDGIGNCIMEFSSNGNTSLAINLNDSIKGREFLKLVSDSDTAYHTVLIYHLSRKDVAEGVFGGLFDTKATHAFIFNNTLYLTQNKAAAQEIIYAITTGGTLKNNAVFMNYANENIDAFCNYVHYLAPNRNLPEVKAFTVFDIDKNRSAIDNLTDANLVIAKQNGILKFRMHLNYQSPSSGEIPNQLWQCQLDSDIVTKPFLFLNHNTQENEIVVQDKLNQLYLINSTGSILWKKKINETLRSEIFTVDLFKNKKYQILFNTDNYLHLIDRNGKYVDGYPIKLPAKASNAISLIDYKGDKDFRIFIACKNNLIYNFNLYGVRTEGYKPFRTDALVKLPVKFVRVGESDYLITIDEAGVLQAFSRKGDGRIGFKNKAIENCQDFAIVATNNINRTFLYYIDDKNNLINRISFADKKDIVKLSNNLVDAGITFQNSNDDQTPDFMAESDNGLVASDINGSVLYKNDKLNAIGHCSTTKNNGNQWYYVYDSGKQKIKMGKDGSVSVTEINANSEPNVLNLFKNEKNYMIYSYQAKLMCNLLK